MKSDKQLKQLALDAWAGKIFTSSQIPEGVELHLVFTALAMMDKDQLQKFADEKPMLFYEYIDEAAPASINGLPMFFSMKWLTEGEVPKFLEYLQKIETALKEI
jgi:hypothetical protein